MSKSESNPGGNSTEKNRPLVNLIGSTIRTNPQVLEGLDLRDRYILFAKSDVGQTRTTQDLVNIFNITPTRINQLYRRTISPFMQPSTNPDSTKGPKISAAMKHRWGDPRFKEKVALGIETTAAKNRSSDIQPKEKKILKFEIYSGDRELWAYVTEHDLFKTLVDGGYLSGFEMQKLSSYFLGNSEKGIERLLNKLSFALAKLA